MALTILQLSLSARETFVSALKKGLPYKTACKLARIPYGRVRYFLQQGEELSEDPYFDYDTASPIERELYDFYIRSAEATALAEQKWVGYVEEAAVTTWQAGMSLLKARNPDDWSETKKVAVEGKVQTTTELDLTKLSVQELEVLEAVLMKLSGDRANEALIVDRGPDKLIVMNEK